MKRYLKMAGILALFAVPGTASAQVFTASGPGGAIISPATGTPNGTPGTPVVTTATITGSGFITGVTVDFAGLAHTWAGDVTMTLTHPNGTTSMDLFSRPGRGTGSTFGHSADFVVANTYSFSDAGAATFATAPPTPIPGGAIQPSTNPNLPTTPDAGLVTYVYSPNSFATTFGGLPGDGVWTLTVNDFAAGDDGAFAGWTINVTTTPIPEPASLILCGVGAGGLVWRRWRRKA